MPQTIVILSNFLFLGAFFMLGLGSALVAFHPYFNCAVRWHQALSLLRLLVLYHLGASPWLLISTHATQKGHWLARSDSCHDYDSYYSDSSTTCSRVRQRYNLVKHRFHNSYNRQNVVHKNCFHSALPCRNPPQPNAAHSTTTTTLLFRCGTLVYCLSVFCSNKSINSTESSAQHCNRPLAYEYQ